jgi:DNA-binding Lrp family transcriptional regulator
MDPLDLRLLGELEGGLPFVPEPFHDIGNRLGISGEEVIERLERLLAAGVIRKFKARINQRLIGISANALVAWKVQDNGDGDAGAGPLLASYPGVTHCYERTCVPGKWEYSLYTVHHGYTRGEVLDEVKEISEKTGIRDYVVLFSTKEFKRVPNIRISENGRGTP